MIETRRLKNVVIFIQTILSFVLSRNITTNIPRSLLKEWLYVRTKHVYFKFNYKICNEFDGVISRATICKCLYDFIRKENLTKARIIFM